MNNRLLIAVVVLLVLAVITVAKFRAREAEMRGDAAAATAPDLTKAFPKINPAEVDGLTFRSEDNGEVTLAKKDGAWRVVSPVDADADQDAVKSALEKLGELAAVRLVSENPENHDRLGVSDRKGVAVTAKKGGAALTKIIVGSFGAGGSMVRNADDKVVYSVEGSMSYLFNKAVSSWRNREITNVTPEEVSEVRWEGKNPFHFVRNDKKEWEPAKGQKALKDWNAGKAASVVSTLSRFRATDFGPAGATADAAGISDASPKVTLTTANGPIVLRLGSKEQNASGFYVMRDGNPTVYIVTDFLSKRVAPTTDLFTQEPPKPGDAQPMPSGMPGGDMGGMPTTTANGQQIPADVLKRLQEQMAAQQQQPQ